MQSVAEDPTAAIQRHRQIDGLRTIAMVGVFLVHFLRAQPLLENLRVSLFFTVSGFLITIILVRARGQASGRVVRNFYVRRMLRLFPALFIALGVAGAANMANIRETLPWHLFQVTNIYVMLHATWDPWVAAHLWSLNMLEQFYLLWPLVILLLPLRLVFAVVAGLVVLPIVVRLNLAELGLDGWSRTVFAFDPIAAGALLALLRDQPTLQAILRSRVVVMVSVLTIASPYVLGTAFGHGETYRMLVVPCLCSIVAGAWHGFSGPVGWLLDNPVTAYISRISYAAYVFHMPLWWLVGERFPGMYTPGLPTLAIMSGLSLGAAALSWYLVERHLNALKARFPTRLVSATGAQVASTQS